MNAYMVTINIAILLFVAYSTWIVAGQRKTIDKLTDKLMAKDLTEYRRGSIELPQEPKQRKPISFYDDPSIEVDEDKVN